MEKFEEVPRLAGKVRGVVVSVGSVKKVYTDLVKSKIVPILGERTKEDK